jgi:hypothetical protein
MQYCILFTWSTWQSNLNVQCTFGCHRSYWVIRFFPTASTGFKAFCDVGENGSADRQHKITLVCKRLRLESVSSRHQILSSKCTTCFPFEPDINKRTFQNGNHNVFALIYTAQRKSHTMHSFPDKTLTDIVMSLHSRCILNIHNSIT